MRLFPLFFCLFFFLLFGKCLPPQKDVYDDILNYIYNDIGIEETDTPVFKFYYQDFTGDRTEDHLIFTELDGQFYTHVLEVESLEEIPQDENAHFDRQPGTSFLIEFHDLICESGIEVLIRQQIRHQGETHLQYKAISVSDQGMETFFLQIFPNDENYPIHEIIDSPEENCNRGIRIQLQGTTSKNYFFTERGN